MNVNAQDEKLLLLQIAEGNENAFAVLVERKWNNIYLQALTYVKVSTQAQDIVQEVFLKLWLRRERLSEIDNFGGWLTTVTTNQLYDYVRKIKYNRTFLNKWWQEFNIHEANNESASQEET